MFVLYVDTSENHNTLSTLKVSSSRQRDPNPPAPPAPSPKPQPEPMQEIKDILGKTIKVAQPDLYLTIGSCKSSSMFPFRRRLPKGKQTIFAITYMRKRAQKWVAPFLHWYLDKPNNEDNADIKKWIENFFWFKKEIQTAFGQTNEVNQTTSLIQHLKWDDNALSTVYQYGLKDNIKDKLMRTAKNLNTLDKLTKEAISIDNKIFKRFMEKHHDGEVGYKESQRGHYGAANIKNTNCRPCYKKPTKANPYGPIPMELDELKTRRLPSGPRKGKKEAAEQGKEDTQMLWMQQTGPHQEGLQVEGECGAPTADQCHGYATTQQRWTRSKLTSYNLSRQIREQGGRRLCPQDCKIDKALEALEINQTIQEGIERCRKVGGDDKTQTELPEWATEIGSSSDWEVINTPDKSEDKPRSAAVTPNKQEKPKTRHQVLAYGNWSWDPEHPTHGGMH